MELDKNAVNRLLASGDTQLWQFIRAVASASGIALPESVSAAEMQTLRQAILGAASSGMSADDAMAYLKQMGVNYKNGGK